MARKFQHKRGVKANLPKLSPAEMGFTTDEKKLYVGDGNENIRLLDQKDKTELTAQLAEMPKKVNGISPDAEGNVIIPVADTTKLATKNEVFLKNNGININDFDESTRQTFLEQQGIDVNYVLGEKNVLPRNTTFFKPVLNGLLTISEANLTTDKPLLSATFDGNGGAVLKPNNLNTLCFFAFNTVIGRKYTVYATASGMDNIRVYGENKTSNLGQLVLDEKGNYVLTFTATTAITYIRFQVAYNGLLTINMADILEGETYAVSLAFDTSNLSEKSIPLSKLETANLSQFNNDLDIIGSSSAGLTVKPKLNRLIEEEMQVNKAVNQSTGEVYATDGYTVSGLIPVKEGEKIFLASIRPGTTFYVYNLFRYTLHKENGDFVSGGQLTRNTTEIQSVTIPSGVKFIRTMADSSSVTASQKPIVSSLDEFPNLPTEIAYEKGYTDKKFVGIQNDWRGKTWVSYGDSITAMGNGASLTAGWQKLVNDYFGIRKHYGRGSGGSTVVFSPNAKFFANPDGSYNNREGTQPPGTTEHNSSMCSWDRITKMIPSDIKDTIDMVFFMGGTNDFISAKTIGTNLSWNAANTLDTKWVNDTAYYNGGDFDINTFKGAVASTIMKLQLWCPNAIIIVGTQLSGYGTNKNHSANTLTLTSRDYALASKDVANYMSVPVIDVFGTTGINQLNYTGFITDGTHPYSVRGQKALARAVIGGLKTILPNI